MFIPARRLHVRSVTGQLWVMEPVPPRGYSNPGSEEPQLVLNQSTCLNVAPFITSHKYQEWDGYWLYGYFGRGVQNADFETFYVMDDSPR